MITLGDAPLTWPLNGSRIFEREQIKHGPSRREELGGGRSDIGIGSGSEPRARERVMREAIEGRKTKKASSSSSFDRLISIIRHAGFRSARVISTKTHKRLRGVCC